MVEESQKTEKEIEKRAKKISDKAKKWLKDPYHAALIGIIILSLIIRIYYFNLTKDQALWWDGLCYGSIAKNFLTGAWSSTETIVNESIIRPMFMSLIWAALMKIGLSEIIIKFIIQFIPSVLSVFLIYIVAEKLYNRRIALIAAFVLAVSWIHIFYSMRMLVHVPALALSLASIYYFLKSLEKEKLSVKHFAVSVFLAFIATLTRWTYGLTGFAYIFYLCLIEGLGFYLLLSIILAGFAKFYLGLSTIIAGILFLVPLVLGAYFNKKNLKIIHTKNFWVGGILGSVPLIFFFTINYFKSGVFFPAIGYVAERASEKTQFYYGTLSFFQHILQQPFFFLFLIGLVIIVVQLFLGYDLIKKSQKLKSHFFVLSVLVLNTAFLIYYMRYAEDRYLLECFVSITLAVAIGIDAIFSYAKKYHKKLAFVLVAILLLSGAYFQYAYGNPIIVSKASSFYQMKQAFSWIKDNTPKDSVLFGSGIGPYSVYYAERRHANEYDSTKNASINFDYLIVHAFSQTPNDYNAYLESIKSYLTPVNVFYFDAAKQQPAVVIYKYNKPQNTTKYSLFNSSLPLD